MNFISRNRYILFIILGIVAMALMIPNITRLINTFQSYGEAGITLPKQMLFLLVEYICIFLAELMFLIIGYRKSMDKYIILASLILYYASTSAYYIYGIFFEQDYASIFNLLIAVLCIVTVFISLTNPRYQFSAIILLLIDAAFNLSDTFTGSTAGFSELILCVLLLFSVILYNRNSLIDNTEYDTFS